jgi:putative AlgH/UPF0301 family transcriptional regulator
VKSLQHLMRSFAVLVALVAGMTSAAPAADLSRAVILVATGRQAGSPFEQAVVIATPLQNGSHFGFVVNRPTDLKLGRLFPDHAAAQNVVDPVYAGGPMLPSVVFAVMRQESGVEDDKAALIMPGVVAVMERLTLDRIIDTRPNDARYFLGLMLWPPGKLDSEVDEGIWQVRRASVDAVPPAHATYLWQSLEGTAL